MDEQAGILQAIVENPDDITHRLVYADWLADHGQDLFAEFIRLHCTLRRFLVDPPAGDRYPVAVEIMSLQPELRPALLQAFEPIHLDLNDGDADLETVLTRRFSFWVHRGLVEDIEVYGGSALTTFVRHARAIFAQVPLLRLTLSRFASREQARLYHPFASIPVIDAVPLSAIYGLLRRPEIIRVRSLDLRDLLSGNELGRCFLRCRRPLQLQRLLLDGNQIEGPVADQLAQRFGKALELRPWHLDDDIPF